MIISRLDDRQLFPTRRRICPARRAQLALGRSRTYDGGIDLRRWTDRNDPRRIREHNKVGEQAKQDLLGFVSSL